MCQKIWVFSIAWQAWDVSFTLLFDLALVKDPNVSRGEVWQINESAITTKFGKACLLWNVVYTGKRGARVKREVRDRYMTWCDWPSYALDQEGCHLMSLYSKVFNSKCDVYVRHTKGAIPTLLQFMSTHNSYKYSRVRVQLECLPLFTRRDAQRLTYKLWVIHKIRTFVAMRWRLLVLFLSSSSSFSIKAWKAAQTLD